MKVHVEVKPKSGVLDPQGNAVLEAMRHFGLEARNCRVGKIIEFEIADGTIRREEIENKLHEVSRDLLSNPVIEDYKLQIEG
ncbi:MAG: phosphoribosylformylglycinamidine synthase subunit PurS [Chthoniobacterales bacterium]|nr:phosphoribosylformylglycinamidine synthase subunit PurS [Chthoniobacterales bacterium]